MIKVTINFEGANPHDAGDVERTGDNAFTLRPYSEDGDGNYKFALLARVANRSDEPVEAEFVVDWGDAEYNDCRDYVLLGVREQWRYFPAVIDGPLARARVVVPPGRHELALHPTYALRRLRHWRRQVDRGARLSVRQLGLSAQGRPIVAFELGDKSAPPAKRLAVLGRFHPYETAGSFAAEGALKRLLLSAWGRRSGRRASVVLIANVDGVADGLCKRTAPGGPDMSHNAKTSDDPGVAALRNWLDELQPAAMLDFHGWMYRYQDGLNYTDAAFTDRFKQHLLPNRDVDRAWKGSHLTHPAKSDSLWAYALERHGTQSLIFSFGWYGRGIAQVRRMGAATVSALDACGG